MEPFDSQDPLTKLLAQARNIEARSNFTANVLRAARQTPQDRGWWATLRAWWLEGSAPAARWTFAAGVTAAFALTLVVLHTQPQGGASTTLAQQNSVPTAAAVADAALPQLPELAATAETTESSPWETVYQTEALLAVEDSTQLTDREIGFLLY